MKKLHVKLLMHRKAANKRACLSYRAMEGKPYYSHHYTEDRELSWCDVSFKKGKKVYNCTFLGLNIALDDAVVQAAYKHPDFDLLPRNTTLDGSLCITPQFRCLVSLENRLHEEGVLVKTGVGIRSDCYYGTGLIVSFPQLTFTEQDILDFINTWDGCNKNWGEFNSKDYPYSK